MTLCFGGLASSGRVDGGDTSDPPTLVSCRKGEAWRSDRLLLNKEVLSPQAVESFVPLLSAVGEDFVRRARAQVGQSGRERWTADFTHELFRFALECEYWGTMCPPAPNTPGRVPQMANVLRFPQLHPQRWANKLLHQSCVSRGVFSGQTNREQPNIVLSSTGHQP